MVTVTMVLGHRCTGIKLTRTSQQVKSTRYNRCFLPRIGLDARVVGRIEENPDTRGPANPGRQACLL